MSQVILWFYALIFDKWLSDCAADYKGIWMLSITDMQDGKVHATLTESLEMKVILCPNRNSVPLRVGWTFPKSRCLGLAFFSKKIWICSSTQKSLG